MASNHDPRRATVWSRGRSPVRLLWVALALALMAMVAQQPAWAANRAQGAVIIAQVNGMSCPFCAYGVRKELLTIPGVKDVRVNLGKSQAIVTVKPGARVTDQQISQAIREAGFSPGPIKRPTAGH